MYQEHLAQNHTIIPIHPIDSEGKCSCRNPSCNAAGKHARGTNWQNPPQMTTDRLARLEDRDGIFRTGNQLLNYGVLLPQSGLIVVDIDGRNGGFASVERLQYARNSCGYIVESGSGNGEHWYFYLPPEWRGKKLKTRIPEYKGIDFKSTGYVVGEGSMHSSGLRYTCVRGEIAKITEAPNELLVLLEQKEKAPIASRFQAHDAFSHAPLELAELSRMLDHIDNPQRDYDLWLRVGMALHEATNGAPEGAVLWEQWTNSQSSVAPKDDEKISYKYERFGRGAQKVTKGTLFFLARKNGYVPPFTMPETSFPQPKIEAPRVNLLRPPGIVGELTEWINYRSRRPREHLAVAGALTIMSNLASLRYYVAEEHTPLNLIILATAGSGSGKGAALHSINEVHRCIGTGAAVLSSFKSAREIEKNILRNQASFYVIDEFGPLLERMTAKGRGADGYMREAMARIAKTFSEANELHTLSGDEREEFVMAIQAKLNKAKTKSDYNEAEIEQLEKSLENAKNGVEKPKLCFYGTSEPNVFNEALLGSREFITGGLYGRSLVFREDEFSFEKPLGEYNTKEPLPPNLITRLMAIFHDGNAAPGDRVDLLGDEVAIEIAPEAKKLLSAIKDHWEQRANEEYILGSESESSFMRGKELTLRVAGVLAAETRVIGLPELEWAFELVRVNLEEKHEFITQRGKFDSRDSTERKEGVVEAILGLLAKAETTAGRIRNRALANKLTLKETEVVLDTLIQEGLVSKSEKKGKNGRSFTYYQLIPK